MTEYKLTSGLESHTPIKGFICKHPPHPQTALLWNPLPYWCQESHCSSTPQVADPLQFTCNQRITYCLPCNSRPFLAISATLWLNPTSSIKSEPPLDLCFLGTPSVSGSFMKYSFILQLLFYLGYNYLHSSSSV